MSHQESYQNDIDRLGDRVKLILESLQDAPEVDMEILMYAGSLLGMGFAALDAAINSEEARKYHEFKAKQE